MSQRIPASPTSPLAPDPVRTQSRDVARLALRVHRLPVPRPAPEPGRLVIVSNRVERNDELRTGQPETTARDVLRMHGGLWFGWSGQVIDAPGPIEWHDTRGGFDTVAIDFDASGRDALFDGFPARVLHPLLQVRLNDMAFKREDLTAWLRINAHLAASLQSQLRADDRIWIQGLHLLPMVSELRALGVRNRIGLFVYDALPPGDILAALPHHERVFDGLIACDLVGVQTARDAHALRDYLTGYHGAVRERGDALHVGAHRLYLSAFPVGIDVKRVAGLARQASERTTLRRFRHDFGAQKLLIGVDYRDPASGLCQRLDAIGCLLRQAPQLAGTFSMLQITPPVRYDMPRDRAFDRKVSRKVSEINARHGTPYWSPVRYVGKELRQQVLAGYLRAADVGVMAPLYDGMALVAKQFVACQDPDDPGVLVLSRFAGAACELTDALQVNPRDAADVAAALRTAMRMPLAERRARWEAQMSALQAHDLQHWSGDFLRALTDSRVAAGSIHTTTVAGVTTPATIALFDQRSSS